MNTEALKELDRIISEGGMPEASQIVEALGEGSLVHTHLGLYPDVLSDLVLISYVRWACDLDDIRAMGAAMKVVKAVLPGWVEEISQDDGEYSALVLKYSKDEPSFAEGQEIAFDPSPARALVLAVIRAKIAEGVEK